MGVTIQPRVVAKKADRRGIWVVAIVLILAAIFLFYYYTTYKHHTQEVTPPKPTDIPVSQRYHITSINDINNQDSVTARFRRQVELRKTLDSYNEGLLCRFMLRNNYTKLYDEDYICNINSAQVCKCVSI
jgi:hypothetical protein